MAVNRVAGGLAVVTALILGATACKKLELGAPCESDGECQTGLCARELAVLFGQCASRCRAAGSEAATQKQCTDRHDPQSLCINAEVCLRACTKGSPCPEGTDCNDHGWCERRERVRHLAR